MVLKDREQPVHAETWRTGKFFCPSACFVSVNLPVFEIIPKPKGEGSKPEGPGPYAKRSA